MRMAQQIESDNEKTQANTLSGMRDTISSKVLTPWKTAHTTSNVATSAEMTCQEPEQCTHFETY